MLSNFILISLISLLTIFVSWLSTYEILGKVWNILPKLTVRPRLRVLLIGVPILVAHLIGIWLYGLT